MSNARTHAYLDGELILKRSYASKMKKEKHPHFEPGYGMWTAKAWREREREREREAVSPLTLKVVHHGGI